MKTSLNDSAKSLKEQVSPLTLLVRQVGVNAILIDLTLRREREVRVGGVGADLPYLVSGFTVAR